MLPHCSHITTKRGWYYYRRRLPRPYCGEIALALRTVNYREAQHLATVLDQAFARSIRSKTSMTNLQNVLRDYLRQALEDDLDQHHRTPAGRPVYTVLRDKYEDPIDADANCIDYLLSETREALARRDIRSIAGKVDRLMEHYGLPLEMRVPFALGVLQADIQALEKAQERVLRGPTEPITLDAPSTPVGSTTDDAAGLTLSELLPDFLDLMVKDDGWRGQTLAQNKTTYKMFMDHCGDRRPDCYTRQDFASFYDLLRALPANYSKNPKWRGKPLKDIAEFAKSTADERLAMKTVKRHFSALGRLFDYLRRRGSIGETNPAHGFEFPSKGRANSKRQMWEGERLAKLFSSPVWTGCQSAAWRSTPGALVIRDEKYWLPLLGLYHGNRLEEFAQLRREDIRCESDIWYFDINGEGDRQIKNEQSRRRVPMHPEILRIGFLKYVEMTALQPTDLVFPELRPGGPDNKLGFYFTKWWSRYRRDIGLYEKGLDYHSFRHGVTTKLYAAGVAEAVVDELTGHEGQGTSRTVYKKDLPLCVLRDAIERIQWPEVAHLEPENIRQKNPEQVSR